MLDALDAILIAMAGVLLYKAPTREMILLFWCFALSSMATLVLSRAGTLDSLGVNWFLYYSIWILIFTATTRKKQIAVLYCAQQVLCLVVVIQWNTDQVMLYNWYSYLVAIIYLKQLGCAYGDYHSRGSHKHSGSGLYMAHNEARP